MKACKNKSEYRVSWLINDISHGDGIQKWWQARWSAPHPLPGFKVCPESSTLDKKGGPRVLNKAVKDHSHLIKTFSQMQPETAKEYRMEEHFWRKSIELSEAFNIRSTNSVLSLPRLLGSVSANIGIGGERSPWNSETSSRGPAGLCLCDLRQLN